MQAGTVDVGPSANGTALVTITFYTALGTVPVVILTPQLGSPDGTTPLVATLVRGCFLCLLWTYAINV